MAKFNVNKTKYENFKAELAAKVLKPQVIPQNKLDELALKLRDEQRKVTVYRVMTCLLLVIISTLLRG